MNHIINSMIRRAEGDYLEREEQDYVLDFVASIGSRIEVMNEVARCEQEIIEHTLAQFYERFPDVRRRYEDTHARGVVDLQLVLRYAAMAHVLDEMRYLEDKLLSWLKPLLHIALPTECIGYMYDRLAINTHAHLSRSSAQVMQVYMERAKKLLI